MSCAPRGGPRPNHGLSADLFRIWLWRHFSSCGHFAHPASVYGVSRDVFLNKTYVMGQGYIAFRSAVRSSIRGSATIGSMRLARSAGIKQAKSATAQINSRRGERNPWTLKRVMF
jgi:hypothetical protein